MTSAGDVSRTRFDRERREAPRVARVKRTVATARLSLVWLFPFRTAELGSRVATQKCGRLNPSHAAADIAQPGVTTGRGSSHQGARTREPLGVPTRPSSPHRSEV